MKKTVTIYRAWNDYGVITVSSARAAETAKQYRMSHRLEGFDYMQLISKSTAFRTRNEALVSFINEKKDYRNRLLEKIKEIDSEINQAYEFFK